MKITITLSHEDFSMLEELCVHKTNRRSKSLEIGWLIKLEWERLQEEERQLAREQELMKTPAGLVEVLKSVHARLEKKAADYTAPQYDARIIQFPVRQLVMGSA